MSKAVCIALKSDAVGLYECWLPFSAVHPYCSSRSAAGNSSLCISMLPRPAPSFYGCLKKKTNRVTACLLCPRPH